jgi:hypothetical protein
MTAPGPSHETLRDLERLMLLRALRWYTNKELAIELDTTESRIKWLHGLGQHRGDPRAFLKRQSRRIVPIPAPTTAKRWRLQDAKAAAQRSEA